MTGHTEDRPAEDPVARLASGVREYGEYGGVNASIEVSTTFTGTVPWLSSAFTLANNPHA
jgi:hypothetical protein